MLKDTIDFSNSSLEELNEEQLLELLLELNNEKNVCSKDLIQKYNSFQNIIQIDPIDLKNIDNLQLTTSHLLPLHSDIKCRISKNKAKNIKRLDNIQIQREYSKHLLSKEIKEKIAIICLNKGLYILKSKTFSTNGVSYVEISPAEIIKLALSTKANNILVIHNHPRGSCEPSLHDINFTIKLKNVLKQININLVDHIIVGSDDTFSFKEDGKEKTGLTII